MSREAEGLQRVSAIQGRDGQDPLPDASLRPILLLLVGASGSGRTTFYEGHLKTVFPNLLRANASPLEQAETDQARKRLLKMGESFVYLSDLFDLEVIREARAAGYEIKAVYLATEDPILNLGRVLLRVNNGGRFAPISRIADDYVRGLSQLPKVKTLTDALVQLCNSTTQPMLERCGWLLTSKLESWSSWHGRYRDGHEKLGKGIHSGCIQLLNLEI